MKEDILEQVVEEYLQHKGYFTRHNVRFKPSRAHPDWEARKDEVTSDVDVVGLNPNLHGADRVWVVSCKSWQSGFDAKAKMTGLRISLGLPVDGVVRAARTGRAHWKYYRELAKPKWSEAFRARVQEISAQAEFKYSLAVTRLKGDPDIWIDSDIVKANLAGNPFSFLTMKEMWQEVVSDVGTTPSATSIGRLAQLLNAAKIDEGVRKKRSPG